MTKTKKVEMRLTRNEYERIRNNAQARGFASVSAYLRFVALETNLAMENKIIETNSNVKKILEIIAKTHHADQTQQKQSGDTS